MKSKFFNILASALLLVVFTSTAAESKNGIGLRLVAEGFVSPLNLVPTEDGSGRVLIADQIGVVQIYGKDGAAKLFMDLRPKLMKLNDGFDERGLLGFALHPRFAENGKLYVYYSVPLRESAPVGWDHTSRIAEFKTNPKGSTPVDLATERVLLEIDESESNHNCGRMAFGPDGFLYIAVGDGGGGNDNSAKHSPIGNGQDLTTHLGKILRLDVDKGTPYAVPSSNPFAKHPTAKPEIFAFGVRNPWGISFDRGGRRELFAADVGQDAFEEINIIVNGGNYGWNLREGFGGFDPSAPLKVPATAPAKDREGRPFMDPIIAYKNKRAFAKDPEARGCSVTGGYVYRGKALPQLFGKYIFGDWSRSFSKADGAVFVATPPTDGGARWTMNTLELVDYPGGALGKYLIAFGENAEGEIYLLTNDGSGLIGKTGKVWKLVPQ